MVRGWEGLVRGLKERRKRRKHMEAGGKFLYHCAVCVFLLLLM